MAAFGRGETSYRRGPFPTTRVTLAPAARSLLGFGFCESTLPFFLRVVNFLRDLAEPAVGLHDPRPRFLQREPDDIRDLATDF